MTDYTNAGSNFDSSTLFLKKFVKRICILYKKFDLPGDV